jgi:FAD-binding domain
MSLYTVHYCQRRVRTHCRSRGAAVGAALAVHLLYRLQQLPHTAAASVCVALTDCPRHCYVTVLPLHAFRFAAGQYCYVNMPWVSHTQWHPFSVIKETRPDGSPGARY